MLPPTIIVYCWKEAMVGCCHTLDTDEFNLLKSRYLGILFSLGLSDTSSGVCGEDKDWEHLLWDCSLYDQELLPSWGVSRCFWLG
jgi:hypothetical protein